ncbi:hypothetical protein WMZ97_13545 [Lentibacillus sp. N15]|uniref:hypothetical protein n=1 Tax=Lentibacillus songyuanensis TaxID=3136161 RepID=UPI0031BB12CA
MNRKMKTWLGLIASLLICSYGVYGLVTKDSISSLSFVPIILAVGGFISLIASVMELKK